ncbi:zinc-ribbon domain-containing protein [Acetitomaculum ruminis DSM 5522]|uniref:Zinc-ribbon domain-containing protein n=1 Tax=Acetitomaculum ruminis DSM 5522 TaxID=1120918 RepID=A0A1I0WQD0_9FIRM|nr:zinc ribbon domain-containing protein [Acetitomaculum ruminis]SFA90186.1 zinc-ribbon domain-containing protein [Acetitomaculum ruminis DSM 5522]
MEMGFAIGLGSFISLVLTIVVCAVVTPKSKEGKYTGFLRFIRDYFLMKYLVVEAILRFFFILTTISCITIGVFLLISHTPSYGFYGYGTYGGDSTAVPGILLIICGPIITRLTYELSMIMIMLLKNTIEINAKMKGDASNATAAFDVSVDKMPHVQNLVSGMTNRQNNQANAPQGMPTKPNNQVNPSQGMPAQPNNQVNPSQAMPTQPTTNHTSLQKPTVQNNVPVQSNDGFKKCPACGNDIESDAKFCPICGNKIG